MKLPEDIHKFLQHRFHRQHRQWFADVTNETWPLILSLTPPTEQIAMNHPDSVRTWITAWQNWRGHGRLMWCERRWSTLGLQRLPDKLVLDEPITVAAWVEQSTRWQQAIQRYQLLIALWPTLKVGLSQYFEILADYSDLDFKRLHDLLHWLAAHPHSNLYPRQLPIPGLDSKWLESRKKIIANLLSCIQNIHQPHTDFFTRCGLKAPPRLLRLRILDDQLSQQLGGLSDFCAPLQDIANLNLPVNQVLIVENLQTGLALPAIPNTVAFMALGYSVDVLSAIPWIKQAQCYYWGDIDTHGFAILNRARQHLPQLRSILMDEATLQSCKALWGEEDKPHSATGLNYLTDDEQTVCQSLKMQPDKINQHVRLEQERIPWKFVLQVLKII